MKPKMPHQVIVLLVALLAICYSNLGCEKPRDVVDESPRQTKDPLGQAASDRLLSSRAKTEAHRKEIETCCCVIRP